MSAPSSFVTTTTASPTFTATTMTKGQLAAIYGLKRISQLHEWCKRVGITLPPHKHLLDPATVANVVEKLGAPHIMISATRM